MEISTTNIKKAFVNFLHRFHVLIFSVVVLGGLAVVVFLLNSIIIRSGDSGSYTSAAGSSSFDQATIDRLNQLKTREETPPPLDFSEGRTNPFTE